MQPELAYVTDASGVIVSVEDSGWNKFIDENLDLRLAKTALSSAYPHVIGRSIFECISDTKIHGFFRHVIANIVSGSVPRVQYQWFCDSPELERRMSMQICGLSLGHTKLVLWLSRILYEKPKPVPALYMRPKSHERIARTVCTYCHRVLVSRKELDVRVSEVLVDPKPLVDQISALPVLGLRGRLGQHLWVGKRAAEILGDTGKYSEFGVSPEHVWLTPEQFYGAVDSRIDDSSANYGICELCHYEMMAAFFPDGWSCGMKPALDGKLGIPVARLAE
ncbi:hypothetical protein HK096_004439 [Nowakowskiella sp. JEL0078]|nr:hypothetical protein HK096_004439 [Nowakowskiella sp. JEL0078]